MSTVAHPKRTPPSLALEAAALAFARAIERLTAERLANPRATVQQWANGNHADKLARRRFMRLLRRAEKADQDLGRAAVALWKSQQRRRTRKP